MIKYFSINGQMVPTDQAIMGINDLAILRGYGIFDYFRFHRKCPLFFEDYLDRFLKSAKLMHLDLPVSRTVFKTQILELIEANGRQDGAIRLLMTGGYSADGYTPARPNLLILQYDPPTYPQDMYTEGVKLITHSYQRNFQKLRPSII